ncbi:hypothetical protein H6G76_26395 [Nostoc sp. FACHB-152]|uniref:hypothetical protein n=1 Tax=unclassified Nostoc TaxID=2593658 RepID=UPI00168A1C49|nr:MULTISPECIES: hypothetical protein [unclassified Nostoc]MBD2450597.1 hypothetical protein [Nostoc sp. FACHB-152]MBD2471232.1 hypothetical protein [Nostoc sp. FACHB-145]
MQLSRNNKSGYLAAIIGSLIGAVVLLYVGGYLGMIYVNNFMPNAELDGIVPPLIGQFLGWWVGEVLGCLVVLRWLNYRKVNQTVKLLAMLTPIAIICWMLFSLFIFQWVNSNFGDSMFIKLHNQFRPISVGITIIASAWLARYMTKPRPRHRHSYESM